MTAGRAFAVLLVLAGGAAAQPPGRLANDEPEVRIDARGRNGVCDVLTFTPDGRTLLAAGEDKVVHRWTVGDQKLTPAGPPLSWNTFRERRGSIYALAVDAPRNRIAVAGFGKLNPDIAILDLTTGTVVAALSPVSDSGYGAREAIWALNFRADGQELVAGDDAGNVWVWRVGEAEAAKRVRLAAAGIRLSEASRVVWVGDLPGSGLAYARRDGGVYSAEGTELHRWGSAVGLSDRVIASADGSALAARPYRGHTGNGVEVWWPATGAAKTVPAPPGFFPERTALDAAGKRLAVGYVDRTGPSTGFKYDRPGEVRVYDLLTDPPTELAKSSPLSVCPDQIALHPDGQRLATADALAHGTSLWRIDAGQLILLDTRGSDTRPLWAVGLSADEQHLSFQTDRDPAPIHPNRRGAGDWQTFDLLGDPRGWAGKPVAPVPPQAERDGWKVAFDPADEANWIVVEPSGSRQPLKVSGVWDQLRDDLPRCFTFLPGPAGGVRLAVGHLWGVSVYDLRPGQKPERVRKLTGHAGYVTAIAPTHGGKGLVTAGRDHTVAFWNLADFPSQPLLGAAFADRAGGIEVTEVDPGSPADEAGLATGDKVVGLMVGGAGTKAPPGDWLSHLRSPRPDMELAVEVLRAGWDKPRWTKTSLLHRPVAKFVPLRGDEWVLYTYRQCFYDSSPNGDRAVQWLVSKPAAGQAPDVFPVGDFRPFLRQPGKVSELLLQQNREPAKPALIDKYPPRVEVLPAAAGVNGNADLLVTVRVTPRNNHLGRPNPAEAVELWANDDTRIGTIRVPPAPAAPVGAPFAPRDPVEVSFTVPNAALQAGSNTLQAAALSRDGGWGTTSKPAVVRLDNPGPRSRRLFVVSVGISEYSQKYFQNLDFSHTDAKRLLEAWDKLASAGGGGFEKAKPEHIKLLTNKEVTRESVLAAIQNVAKEARADDLLVLAVSGHGILGDSTGRLPLRAKVKVAPERWYFVIPQTADGKRFTTGDEYTDPALVRKAFLADDVLFDALADGVKCRKLLLLDCCHSGKVVKSGSEAAVTKNVGGTFGRNGFGPVVLAACAENEEAVEHPTDGAVFTTALVDALKVSGDGGRFSVADADGDGRLTARELAAYLAQRVKAEAAKLATAKSGSHVQNAQSSPGLDDLGRLTVAERKQK